MASSWNVKNRCPNCDGYAGAWKKEQRCRGFAHRDGEGYFCEQPPEGLTDRQLVAFRKNYSGYDLFWHSYE